jgi:hypothetical protein
MAEFSRDLGVSWATAHQWRLREYIPAEYWERLIDKARERKIKGITPAVLAEIASARPVKAKPPTERQTARAS